jgi:hypothetical protein
VDAKAVGERVRAVRGERTRAEYIKGVYDATGLYISEASLYRIEAGKVKSYVLEEARALMLAHPRLAPLFLGADLYESIVAHSDHFRGDDGEQEHCAHAGAVCNR